MKSQKEKTKTVLGPKKVFDFLRGLRREPSKETMQHFPNLPMSQTYQEKEDLTKKTVRSVAVRTKNASSSWKKSQKTMSSSRQTSAPPKASEFPPLPQPISQPESPIPSPRATEVETRAKLSPKKIARARKVGPSNAETQGNPVKTYEMLLQLHLADGTLLDTEALHAMLIKLNSDVWSETDPRQVVENLQLVIRVLKSLQ